MRKQGLHQHLVGMSLVMQIYMMRYPIHLSYGTDPSELTDITTQESSEDNYSLSFDGVDDYVGFSRIQSYPLKSFMSIGFRF